MNVTIDGNDLLRYCTEFQMLSDEEIEKRANGDVEKHLLLLIERDFVQGLYADISKDLLKWLENEK